MSEHVSQQYHTTRTFLMQHYNSMRCNVCLNGRNQHEVHVESLYLRMMITVYTYLAITEYLHSSVTTVTKNRTTYYFKIKLFLALLSSSTYI